MSLADVQSMKALKLAKQKVDQSYVDTNLLSLANGGTARKLNNLFVDSFKTYYTNKTGSSTTTNSSSNLGFGGTSISLGIGRYFVLMKINMSVTGTMPDSGIVYPMLFNSVTQRYYTDETTASSTPNNLNINANLNKDVEMCTVLNVDIAGVYYPYLYMSNAGTTSKTLTATIKDMVIVQLTDIPNLQNHKTTILNLSKSNGYTSSYTLYSSKTGKVLDYWGDSLTAGNQDGTGVSRPSVMQSLLGSSWTVNNYGAGGEQSNTIAARQGGMSYVAQPTFTIPATTTAVTINILDNDGNAVNIRNSVNTGNINPCYINGIKGTLTSDSGSPAVYTFTRNTAGTAVTIDRPTTIITNGMLNSTGNPLIIFIGQNGGYNSDNDYLVQQIKQMIEISQSKKYLVISLTTSGKDAQNTAMKKAFGRHFIDARSYLIQYGLSDMGITPTTQDNTDIAANNVPSSLLNGDGIHFNRYGYTVIANLEYKRGQELGYW